MLGRELEVPLDAITEAPPDSPSLKTDYAQAVQKRLASAHDLARRRLNKAAVAILLNLWEPDYGLGFPGVLWVAPQMSGRGN